ncbi:carbohydrate porin [Pleurocapsales cyanobacterium LEGE 10410]|nr:carbohydrate porin [Pleurocapsales cyanobacterium LEGE 10410]
MSKFWGKISQIVPVFAIYILLPSKIEAAEISRSGSVDQRSEIKTSSQILNRPVNFADNLPSKTDNLPLLITQINSVQQLRNIRPTDWSYEALRNLVERYGCISGFEDRTYRGEQIISRAEFAAGLNACLNKIEQLVANSDDISQVDVDTVLLLIEEFQSDLAIIRGKTDGSQARLEDLEVTQFSTTSKLRGEAIFGLGSVLSSDRDNTNTIFGSRLRLELGSSFVGDDLLFTRLSRTDFSGFTEESGTFQGNLAFAESDDSDNLQLDALHYSFAVGDRLKFIVGVAGIDAEDIAPTVNFLDGDGGSGAISAFGTRNPIYYLPGDAGVGITHSPIDRVDISVGYLAAASESSSGSELFNGPYSALGQVTIAPVENLSLAATYIHSYNQSDTETGTNRANLRSLTSELFGSPTPTVSNSYGLELSWAISDRLIVGGWGGLSKVSNLSTLNGQIDRGTQDIWNWAATLVLPDLGMEGSLAGIVVGSEPRVTNSSIDDLGEDNEQSLHLEAFYQYQLNDNISITPGVVWITEPDTNASNYDDLVIGTIRTTFSF